MDESGQTPGINERDATFLLALNDALRPLAEVGDIKATTVRWIARHLNANRVYYAEVAGDDLLIEHDYAADPLEIAGPTPMNLWRKQILAACRSGTTLTICDVHTDELFAGDDISTSESAGFVSGISVPLMKDGVCTAVLGITSRTPRTWTPHDVRLVESVVERTWAAIERAHAERRLRDVLEDRVRDRTAEVQTLFHRLVSVQEDERRRIARDVHDQLGQQMTALRMNLETWRALSARDPALLEHADRTLRLAEELDRSIDFLTWELRPPVLDHFGLSAVLPDLVTGWSERVGIAAEFHASGDDDRLAPAVESNVYRLVQEALHNVLKHAQATRVTVSISRGEDEMVLVIEDNGRGFDEAAVLERRGSGLGLVSMRERAALLGGRFNIESRPGAGTTIMVRVPTGPGDFR